jgi:hypothetical protein
MCICISEIRDPDWTDHLRQLSAAQIATRVLSHLAISTHPFPMKKDIKIKGTSRGKNSSMWTPENEATLVQALLRAKEDGKWGDSN